MIIRYHQNPAPITEADCSSLHPYAALRAKDCTGAQGTETLRQIPPAPNPEATFEGSRSEAWPPSPGSWVLVKRCGSSQKLGVPYFGLGSPVAGNSHVNTAYKPRKETTMEPMDGA